MGATCRLSWTVPNGMPPQRLVTVVSQVHSIIISSCPVFTRVERQIIFTAVANSTLFFLQQVAHVSTSHSLFSCRKRVDSTCIRVEKGAFCPQSS